jgi:MoaA/NifB/PqqE/SkfB family radical SAM enzyme
MGTEAAIPSYVYLKLFDDCNARCNMCDCWQAQGARLNPSHYNAVVGRLAAAGVREVRFTGGEPLLYRQLPAVIEYAVQSGLRVSVITNGWLLPTRLPELVTAGCREVVVSVDGTQPTHDAIRGRNGLFDRCLRGMALARTAGLSLVVNTVLQSSNADSLDALSGVLLAARHRPVWWHLIPVRDRPDLHPSAAQIASLRGCLPQLRDACRRAGTELVADSAIFEPQGRSECPVPQGIAYIDGESGQVHGCNMLSYVGDPIGNVLTTPLTDIYRDHAARQLQGACAVGAYSGCDRCDKSSRGMNLLFIERSNRR